MEEINVSDEQIKSLIQTMVYQVDLETTGVNKFIKLMSKGEMIQQPTVCLENGFFRRMSYTYWVCTGKEVGQDLKSRKPFIKEVLTEAINNMGDDGDDEPEEEESEEEAEPQPKQIKKKKSKGGGGGGGGLAVKKRISAALAKFFGEAEGTELARTEIVKRMWEYIREHDLQNPENKKEIFLDEDMKGVFGCDKFTMFSMNKYIGAHVDPFKPVDLTTNTTPSKKRKAKSKNSSVKKKRRQPLYRLSEELTSVVGTDVMSRPQVVKEIWVYIRGNELQNPNDKREIFCDEKLQAVMKRSKVTMFNMNKELSRHFLEQLEGQYAGDDDNESD